MNISHRRSILIVLSIIVVIGSIALAILVFGKEKNANDPAASSSQSEMTTSDTTAEYLDGTYRATGSYFSPGGRESIGVELTLKDGRIVESMVTENATSSEGKEYQSRFASNYKEMVTGKSIDAVSLSRVAGSSLTSNGFNDALDQIKDDAKN